MKGDVRRRCSYCNCAVLVDSGRKPPADPLATSFADPGDCRCACHTAWRLAHKGEERPE